MTEVLQRPSEVVPDDFDIQQHSETSYAIPNITDQCLGDDGTETTQAVRLLLTRMLLALQYRDYPIASLRKVAALITKNLTCTQYSSRDALSVSSVEKLAIASFSEQTPFHINSNEVVLFLSLPQSITRDPMRTRDIRGVLLQELRCRGIKPVRVYVRSISDSDSSEINAILLNSVNTDIGGPGMVQLLDDAFHGEEWSYDLVSKEAWREYDLLWRAEAWPVPSIASNVEQYQNAIVKEADDRAAESDVVVVQVASEPEESLSQVPANDVVKAGGGEDKKEEVVAQKEESQPFNEHPEMTALQMREASRAHVQHPTWSRDDSSSLLDIIASQSSEVPHRDLLSVIESGQEPQSAAVTASESQSHDFELVEKL